MLQNLKDFVFTFTQKQKSPTFPTLYIVDRQTGPYRRIQDAIDAAEPNSLIKVTEGFYEENLVITKPVSIQPKSGGGKGVGVVLLVEAGVGVHVKLPYSQSQVSISGLKISHTGNTPQLHTQLINHQHILNLFEDTQPTCDQPQHEYINRVSFSKLQNIVILIQSGRVSLNMCVLSLKYLVKSCKGLIPAVCVDRGAELSMVDCEVKGNQGKETVGVLCKLGVVSMRNCVVGQHKEGGVVIWGAKQNPSKIIKSKLHNNSIAIHVLGQQSKPKISQNHLTKNTLALKIGLACEPEISRNYITENHNGIEAISSFPVIYLNKITKNEQNGIHLRSYKGMSCGGRVKRNVAIVGNRGCGVLVSGVGNVVKIVGNYMVGYNGCGVKVEREAYPLVLKNFIHKNFQQGILITEDASAVIEKNTITANIQCNIALGGSISHNTLIVQNKISNSPGPGIVSIEGMCNIIRNDITQNSDGIRLIDSGGRIRRNFISGNTNDGVSCRGECNPLLVENFVTRNAGVGVLMCEEGGLGQGQRQRQGQGQGQGGDGSGVIYSNIIVSNQINFGVLFNNKEVNKRLKQSNTIQGNINEPLSLSCALI